MLKQRKKARDKEASEYSKSPEKDHAQRIEENTEEVKKSHKKKVRFFQLSI